MLLIQCLIFEPGKPIKIAWRGNISCNSVFAFLVLFLYGERLLYIVYFFFIIIFSF